MERPEDPDAGRGRAVRRLTLALAAGTVLLIGGLAALPLIASRPRPAPDPALTTIAGDTVRLSSLRGQPVLVSFWSTTCATCLSEMPALVEMHRRYAPRGLRTIAVSMRHDRPAQVLGIVRAQGLPFDIVLDDSGELARDFNDTQSTPTKFLIDGDGRIVRVYAGFTDFADLQRRLDRLLGA